MANTNMFSREQVSRCFLCPEPQCSASCPHGSDPGKLLRSAYFDNELGAALSETDFSLCENCEAPCEKACVNEEAPIGIRSFMRSLGHGRDKLADNLDIFDQEVDLSCTFCGYKLENPFLLSSSVVASSYEKLARAFDMGWAGASYKTICDFIPQETSPRYAAVTDGGRFGGFKNIEQLSQGSLEEDLDIIRRIKKDYPTKLIIASIMGRDEAEWERLSHLVEEAGADIVECNFSCPNMEENGLGVDIGQDPEAISRFTRACRRGCTIPILAKLTPNVASMVPMAEAAMEAGADGIAAINTIKSLMKPNLETFVTEPSVGNRSGIGGYSGRAVKPIALRHICEVASDPKIRPVSISGMGGINTWIDAVEFIILGANNVQVTTSVMEYGYRIIDDLIDGTKRYLQLKGMHSIEELYGKGLEKVVDLDQLDRTTIEYPKFHPKRCAGCGRCSVSCRDGGHEAITMRDGRPYLDPDKCVGCHLCTYVCPRSAITASGTRRYSRYHRNIGKA